MSRFLRGLRGGTASSSTDSTAPTATATTLTTSSSSSTSSSSRIHSPSPNKGSSTPLSKPTSHLLFLPHDAVQRPSQEVLSIEDQAKVKRLRDHMEKSIRAHYYHPTEAATDNETEGSRRDEGSKDAQGVLVEPFYEQWEYRWLDLEQGEGNTVRRYLRAAKGNEDDAIKRLEASLTWRRSFKPDIIPPEDVRIEAETGKSLPLGFDVQGRVVLYLNPGKENTKPSERQIRHAVWGLERAIDLLPPYQSKLTLVIDFKQASQAQNPNMSTSLKVLNILQNHYVERLGLGLALNPPWYLNAFWASVQPFIDPITKTKVKWNPQGEELRGLIPPEHLPKYYGGDYDFVFDKDVFWSEELDWCGIAPDGTRVHESWSRTGGRGINGGEAVRSVGENNHNQVTDDGDDEHNDVEPKRPSITGRGQRGPTSARPSSTISSGAASFASASAGAGTGTGTGIGTAPVVNGQDQ